jgi:cytochrome c-type biogenesis protein CcmH
MAGVSAAEEPTFSHIEESLTCQCGCGLTVHSCNHLQCPSALPLREEIREQMALGKGTAEILSHFAEKYGEKILSSPTTSGFNLTAWVTPFVAVALGMFFVSFTLLRWRRQTPTSAAAAGTAASMGGAIGPKSEHQKTLERELEEFDV